MRMENGEWRMGANAADVMAFAGRFQVALFSLLSVFSSISIYLSFVSHVYLSMHMLINAFLL